jgi:hypothetical protein
MSALLPDHNALTNTHDTAFPAIVLLLSIHSRVPAGSAGKAAKGESPA